MASSSVSFRISRSAEDLAETIHALSQRLVMLEQRLAALEVQLTNQNRLDPQEQGILENVDRLLQDCRDLLAIEGESPAAVHQEETGSVSLVGMVGSDHALGADEQGDSDDAAVEEVLAAA